MKLTVRSVRRRRRAVRGGGRVVAFPRVQTEPAMGGRDEPARVRLSPRGLWWSCEEDATAPVGGRRGRPCERGCGDPCRWSAFVCVAVWRRLAWLRGLTRWLSGVSGSAAVRGWRCPGAVVLSLFLQPREGGPGGEDAAPLHKCRLLGKSGDDSARVSAETVTWGNVVKSKYPGRSVAARCGRWVFAVLLVAVCPCPRPEVGSQWGMC